MYDKYTLSYNNYRAYTRTYIYYIKQQCPFVCLSVPPFFFDTTVGPHQIWHTYSDRSIRDWLSPKKIDLPQR